MCVVCGWLVWFGDWVSVVLFVCVCFLCEVVECGMID